MGKSFNKIYLASPFFNDEQRKVVSTLEEVLANISEEVYSPSRDGIKLVMKESTLDDRQRVFDSNCYNIDDADAVVAFIDNSDQGTIWEVGRALALRIPVLVILKVNDTEYSIFCRGQGQVLTTDLSDDEFSSYVVEYLTNSADKIYKDSSVIVIGQANGAMESAVLKKYDRSLGYPNSSLYPLHSELSGASLLTVMSDTSSLINTTLATRVILVNIDDRSELASLILGQLFADPNLNYKVITFSNSDYGLNLMLQHSVADHYTELEPLLAKIDSMLGGDYEVSQSFVKSTDKFE